MADQKFPVKSLCVQQLTLQIKSTAFFYLANTTAQKDAVMHCHKHGEAQRELWSPLGVRWVGSEIPSKISV